MRWFLLPLTIVSIWLTVDAFRWQSGAKDIPFSAISKLWKQGLDHMSLVERQAFLERYRSSPILAIRLLPRIFAVVSVALLIATVREFLA